MRRDEALVAIAVFGSSLEASLARGALEAIGIPAFVPGEALGAFSTQHGGISTTELQVFESDRDRALVELGRMQIRIARPRSDHD